MWNVTQRIRRFSNSGFSSGYLQDFPTLPNPMLSDSDETLFSGSSGQKAGCLQPCTAPPLRPSCKRKEKSWEILIQVAFPSFDTPSQSACFCLLFRSCHHLAAGLGWWSRMASLICLVVVLAVSAMSLHVVCCPQGVWSTLPIASRLQESENRNYKPL